MKLRIKKIYIQNFKGLKGSHTIEFGQRATFLFGPNGYGKTTMFDALELLLTGRIARLEGENNEHGGKKHEASVIHNNKDSDVVLKLNIELNGVVHFILRRFPRSTEKLGYDKFWKDLETYLLDSFDQEVNESMSSFEQEELESRIFGVENEEYLAQYFRLLTYVPQSESVYFLKMSQSDRYSKLSPLLDMSEQSSSLESVRSYRMKLFALKKYLEDKLKEYDEIPVNTPKETTAYERLTSTEEIGIYDEPKPFDDLSMSLAQEKRARINTELNEIKEFLSDFKPKEFAKQKLNQRLIDIFKNDSFAHYLVFKDILSDGIENIEKNYALSLASKSNNFLNKFILRNHLTPTRYNALEQIRLAYIKYRSVLFDDTGEARNSKSMLMILADESNAFNDETQAQASKYLDEYVTFEKNVNSSQQLLKQLQEYRDHVVVHSKKLGDNVDPKSCPLCGYDWSSEGSLLDSIKLKTDNLQDLIGNEAKSLIAKEKSIKQEFLDDIINKGSQYLERYSEQYNFFQIIRRYGSLTDEDISNFDILASLALESVQQVTSQSDLSTDHVTRAQSLAEIIDRKVGTYDKKVMAVLRSLGAYNFTKDYAFIEDSGVKLSKSDLSRDKLHNFSSDDLSEKSNKYRKEIQAFIDKNEVNSDAVVNAFMYKSLFLETESSFEKAKAQIANKFKYLDEQFATQSMVSRKKYEKQYTVIAPLSDKMYALSKDFDKSLKRYQFGLTQPLKAPFYVYSAKILQNNPNGQGIFIKTESESSNIVFTANPTTSHDALHQLSSGQLAVVSMAFHLSMNAVYTNKSLNLLIVDDPIQDMDSLNVHSFSELLRREFIEDYQIIMSTHDDLDMQYLKYMFGRAVNPEDIKAWNVQELFYKVS